MTQQKPTMLWCVNSPQFQIFAFWGIWFRQNKPRKEGRTEKKKTYLKGKLKNQPFRFLDTQNALNSSNFRIPCSVAWQSRMEALSDSRIKSGLSQTWQTCVSSRAWNLPQETNIDGKCLVKTLIVTQNLNFFFQELNVNYFQEQASYNYGSPSSSKIMLYRLLLFQSCDYCRSLKGLGHAILGNFNTDQMVI